MFPSPNMEPIDERAVAAAKLTGRVETSTGRNPGKLGCDLPQVLMHGTSIKNALSIISDGGINASDGICGTGFYPVECKSFDDADLLATFQLLGDLGYNTGAAFVMEPDGILVHSNKFSSHPGSVLSESESPVVAVGVVGSQPKTPQRPQLLMRTRRML